MRMRSIFLAGLLLFLAAPFTYLPGNSSADGYGCIEVQVNAQDRGGSLLEYAPAFTVFLDGRRSETTNGAGRARFDSVSIGSHRVTERVPSGWGFLNVVPSNGTVTVPNGGCAQVTFSNKIVGPITIVGTCNDNLDNDGDNRTDQSDTDCHTDGRVSNGASYDPSRRENSTIAQTYQCNDGVDNDRDGRTDRNDPNCHIDGDAYNGASYSRYRTETTATQAGTRPQCNDTRDNDRDGRVDYPADTGCSSYLDDSEYRPGTTAYYVDDNFYTNIPNYGDPVVANTTSSKPVYRTTATSTPSQVNGISLSTYADLVEALPGDTVWYTIRVQNNGTARSGLRVEGYFDPNLLTITNSGGGTVTGDTIRWNLGAFAANEQRLVRFSAKVRDTVAHGTSVRVNSHMWATNVELSGGTTVRILSHLPQTGVDLKSLAAAASPSANPLFFLSMVLMGIGLGGGLMKKILPA